MLYYRDDRAGISIYHGDCRDILPRLTEPVDLVLTDPPYGDVTHEGARGGDGTRALVDFASINDADVRCYLELLTPLAQSWFVATMEWRHIAIIERDPPPGWRFVRFGVWVKPNGAPQFTGDRPATGWEGVAILHRDGGRMRWNGGGKHAVWTMPKVEGDHPTAKPIKLMREWVAQFSNPGDLILDPFMGSGTTLRAAMDLGRRAIGIELEERYCEIAARRLSQMVLPLGAA